MTEIIPTVGRIVLYMLTQYDADKINKRRDDANKHMLLHQYQSHGTMVHVGNMVHKGQQYPALVVAVWGDNPTSAVNLKVELDGSDNYWATSRSVGDDPGSYQWMAYQKAVAAGEIPPTLHAPPDSDKQKAEVAR